MAQPFPALPAPGSRPFIVEVRRGIQVESRHDVAAVIVDADGGIVAAWGDAEAPVFPRSSNKAIQALPLLESGAVQAFGLQPQEIALAGASHGGEARHTEAVAAWLGRIGLDAGALECGAHWPYHEETARSLSQRREQPSALHNNCSGKHAGMVTFARQMNWKAEGYVRPDHAVQRAVTAALEDVCAWRFDPASIAVDGCSMPTMPMPLYNLAYGFARYGSGQGLGPERAKAAQAFIRAALAEPFFIAGSGRFCTAAIEAGQGRYIAKTGAEGVYTASIPEQGLGIALKVLDGTARAAQTALGGLLEHLKLLDEAGREKLRPLVEQKLSNWRGIPVGSIGLATAF